MSPEDVVERFLDGEPESSETLASIPVSHGRHVLVGYGYAVYAIRHNDGFVTRFGGWRGRSKTTSRHLGYLDGAVDFQKVKAPDTSEILDIVDREEV